MRNTGSQGRKIGSSRPNRDLARRRIGLSLALRAAPLIFAAIALHALAFVIWNLGSRSPAQLVHDARVAFASAGSFRKAAWQFTLGSVVLLAGAMVMLSVTLIDIRTEFTVLESIAILSGLIVETLIGRSIRSRR